MNKLEIIAHRGAMNIVPENTLAAFDKALELGADAIEFDLHFSSDEKLIVHHDYTFEKVTGSPKPIYQVHSRDIKTIDVGSWFHSDFARERVPFFEDVLQLAKNKCRFEIELKGSTIKFVEEVIKMAMFFDVLNDIEFTSPHLFVLNYIKTQYPHIKCGVFVPLYPSWLDQELGEKLLLDQMDVSGYEVAHLPLAILNSNLVKKLHSIGKIAHAANCDEEKDILFAVECTVDQLSTGNIRLAKQVLSKHS